MSMTLPGAEANTTSASTGARVNAQPKEQVQQQTNSTFTKPQMGNNMPSLSLRKNRGFGRSSTSEAMRKVLEQLNKIAETETSDSAIEYKFIPLDAEKEGLNISAVVVTCAIRNPQEDQKAVVFHTLLMGASSRGVKSRDRKVAQTSVTYEDIVLPTDGMDPNMLRTVYANLNAVYPGYKQYSAEWTVIPAVLNLDSEEAVRNIASNATTAVWTVLASEVAGEGWVIDRDFKGMRTGLSVKTSDTHFVGLDGLPVRSDIVLELNEISQSSNSGKEWQFNGDQNSELLMQINGFFDLVYFPVQPYEGLGFGVGNVAQTTDALLTYRPRFVITNVDSPESCDLTLQLLGLAATQVLPTTRQHIPCLIEQHRAGERNANGGLNTRDLGAIGLEVPRMVSGIPGSVAPEMERFPTQGASFTDDSLATLIRMYVDGNNMLISLDVPEGGPSTWMTAVFAAAARGDQTAIDDIIAAADVLTSNRFTPIYTNICGGAMSAPLFDDNLIVNMGTYPAQNVLRDIRDIAYLEVLNLTGDTTMDVIKDWSNLQANESVDEYFRAMEARNILHKAFAALQVTGRARRVTFNNDFLRALLQAVRESGLSYELTASKSAPTGTGRLTNSYLGQQSRSLTSSNAFSHGGHNRQDATTTTAGSFGRFSYGNNMNNQNSGY